MGMGRGRSAPITRIILSSRSYVPTTEERLFYRDFISQLVARRKALRLTQEDLDRMLGVTDHQVAKWESLERLPGAFMLMCWLNALGAQLDVRKDFAR